MKVAPYFRIDAKRAKLILNRVKKSISNWRLVAKSNGRSKADQDSMATAFEQY